MNDGLILDGVDDDLGDRKAHHDHQGEGEEIEKRRDLEI
jgi:hypothetical protein